MMNLKIHNETSPLEIVILGIAESFGDQSANNPKSKYHKENNTYPKEEDVIPEVKTFEEALLKHNVEVLRPLNIPDRNQIFTRDIGFVIDDYFIISNMKKESRKVEINGIKHILAFIDETKIIRPPENVDVEGGDIILWNDYVFVGKSDRTNDDGYFFLKDKFKSKNVVQIDVIVSENYENNVLHLDCAFQPIGDEFAIYYAEAFSKKPEPIFDCFKERNLIQVTKEQMVNMVPNIFSISKTKVVIEKSFVELKNNLLNKGFEVIEVSYNETSKFGGLLRCSTLPLKRKY